MNNPLKLNLGCGQNPLPGYLNVDKFGHPDFYWDLENFPWPWEDNSVSEIVLHHVLEHLGESSQTYLKIIQELYRVCQPNALILITVPHPRHDSFLADPTHVRVVTLDGLALFSKPLNYEWKHLGYANSPLGLYLDVDFEIIDTQIYLEEPWQSRYQCGELTEAEVLQSARQFNNIIKQTSIHLKVIKDTFNHIQLKAAEHLKNQQYELAIALYQACIELEPDEIQHYWHLGLAHFLAEDEETAQEIWCSTLLQEDAAALTEATQNFIGFLEHNARQQAESHHPETAQGLVQQILALDPTYSVILGVD
jgi:predicted SAM-dependent methyltransferase